MLSDLNRAVTAFLPDALLTLSIRDGLASFFGAEWQMKKMLLSCALVAALCAPAVAGQGGNSQSGSGQGGNSQGGNGGYHGAPGPTIGAGLAGLPVLAVGYGIYWLVTRRRRQT